MRQDRFTDLDPAQLIFIHRTDHVTGTYPDAVKELYGIVTAVNAADYKAIPVLFKTIGMLVEIIPFPYGPTLFLHGTVRHLPLKLQRGCRVFLRQVYAFQIQVAVRRRTPALHDPLDRDLLDQAFVVRFHGIQTIDHIVDAVALMGS